jgi:integrase
LTVIHRSRIGAWQTPRADATLDDHGMGVTVKGTVYKRCSRCGRTVPSRVCDRCGSGPMAWAFRVRVGKDADGRWIEERRSGFETKAAAQTELTALLADVGDGSHVPRSDLTVKAFLLDRWLPATGPPHVSFQTWDDRRINLTHHVVPYVGEVLLQDLAPDQITRLYGRLLREGRVDGGGGLSPTSVRRIHAMIRKACNDAVRWGLLRRNPVTLADPPPARAADRARRRSMQTWSPEQLRTFLATTEGDELHRMWLLAAMTGLRRSELAGLKWDAVDIQRRLLTVRTTVVPVAAGEYGLEHAQKSMTSARSIHLDGRTAAALANQRDEVQALRRSLGRAWNPDDVVFPTVEGAWRLPGSITATFERTVRAAPVPRIRLHDLRHTHATLLLRAGINPKVVSERLGHSSVAFTLDTYAHIMPGMQPEAAEKLADLVWGDDETGVA